MAAWALWVLVMLGLAAGFWLEDLLRRAGPDPLRLVAMFGLHPNTAARYATTVRTHIEDAAATAMRAPHSLNGEEASSP